MSTYRRHYEKGCSYFFTVVTWRRQKLFHNPDTIEIVRQAFRTVMARRPFVIDAIVLLPDHLHCLWKLPDGDDDYSTRWMLIKKHISTTLQTRTNKRREKLVWQRRFWEHMIRDEQDWQRHMDYIHYNPVKHGYTAKPLDWEYGSFAHAVAKGLYEREWGVCEPITVRGLECE